MSLLDAFLEDALEESAINAARRREVFFAIRSDAGVPRGRGTREDPYNGTELYIVVQGVSKLQLDDILNNLEEDTTIHLGPGVFKTGGGVDPGRTVRHPWQRKPG